MADISEPTGKYREIGNLIKDIGIPAVMCGFLAWLLWHELGAFRRDIAWKLERSIRNERAIMQKLQIPVILDGERAE